MASKNESETKKNDIFVELVTSLYPCTWKVEVCATTINEWRKSKRSVVLSYRQLKYTHTLKEQNRVFIKVSTIYIKKYAEIWVNIYTKRKEFLEFDMMKQFFTHFFIGPKINTFFL